MLTSTTENRVNGINLDALGETVEAIQGDADRGMVEFRVASNWTGQTRSESVVEGYTIGGEWVERGFRIVADEPFELLGNNSAANPQELLMSAVNACMIVGYVAQAAVRGVQLRTCRIETSGELDLRGFLGIDAEVAPGYGKIDCRITLDGDGTREQFEAIHAAVQATSPNYYNMTRPIQVNAILA